MFSGYILKPETTWRKLNLLRRLRKISTRLRTLLVVQAALLIMPWTRQALIRQCHGKMVLNNISAPVVVRTIRDLGERNALNRLSRMHAAPTTVIALSVAHPFISHYDAPVKPSIGALFSSVVIVCDAWMVEPLLR